MNSPGRCSQQKGEMVAGWAAAKAAAARAAAARAAAARAAAAREAAVRAAVAREAVVRARAGEGKEVCKPPGGINRNPLKI